MRKVSFVAPLLLCLTLTLSSCGAWYQQFKDNPVAYVDDFTAKTNIIVSDLTNTFNDVVANLPADKQAQARADWQKGLTALTAAQKALRSSIDAAVAAQASQIDLGRLIADVVVAVQNIIRIVDTFRIGAVAGGNSAGYASDPFVANYLKVYGHK